MDDDAELMRKSGQSGTIDVYAWEKWICLTKAEDVIEALCSFRDSKSQVLNAEAVNVIKSRSNKCMSRTTLK